MPRLPSDEYERIVAGLAEGLVKSTTELVEAVGHGRRNKVRGASGYSHQIDVSIQTSKTLFLIECKSWNKKVSTDAVLTFLGRMVDIKPRFQNRETVASLVTTVGAQPGAETIADHFGIEVHVVRSPLEYVIRFKNRVHVGDVDGAVAGDDFAADVQRQ